MSLYQSVSNTGVGGVQLVDIGNTGSNELQLGQGAIMKGVSKFVLAVPGGQQASAGNILQQIALSAAAEKQQTILAKQQQVEPPNGHSAINRRKSLRPKPAKRPTYEETVEAVPPPAPRPRRRSRKQKLTQPEPGNEKSLSASLPQLNEEIVLVPVIAPVQQPPPPREKRKRKSPMRSTNIDTFGEPEFTEMYYFEESENEDDDSYAGNVIHLMKERQRRREMTDQFESLGRIVVPREVKPSRNLVLKKSTHLVKNLKAKAVSLRVQKTMLREINVGLRKRLAELLGVSTHINYESEEEEVERVGGYKGYKSSSSDPDNNDAEDDDDDDLDWGVPIDLDDDAEDDCNDDVKQEGESNGEFQDDFKVELPDDGEEGDDFDGAGEGDDEEEEDDSRIGVRIKQEPGSDDDDETEQHSTAVLSSHRDNDDDDESQPKFTNVRIKLEPGVDNDSADNVGVDSSAADEAASASAAVETSTESTTAIMPSPRSSVHQSNQRNEDDEIYDRYDRVKIEPRSPVRRALFMDSHSQDSMGDRALDENVLVAATLDMDSLQAVKTEHAADDGGEDLAQNLDDPSVGIAQNLDDPLDSGMRINLDSGLFSMKQEFNNSDSNF